MTPDGRIEWITTNDLDQQVNRFVAELNNDNRWQVEEFYRGFKQLTGLGKCQCRKGRSQRNHLACCYHAWVSLKVRANFLIIWSSNSTTQQFLLCNLQSESPTIKQTNLAQYAVGKKAAPANVALR